MPGIAVTAAAAAPAAAATIKNPRREGVAWSVVCSFFIVSSSLDVLMHNFAYCTNEVGLSRAD